MKKENLSKYFLGILLLLLLIVLAFVFFKKDNPLQGRWSMDDITIYEFQEGNQGKMILPSAEYEFTYQIKDQSVSIDFAYEGAKDAKYIFEVEGDTLILEGGNDTTKGTYTLDRCE